MKVVYSVATESDLTEIGVYTWTRWGEQQWLQYASLLTDTCERIIPQNVKHARRVPHHSGFLLRWQCERHHIYFRTVPGGIEIVRVLHERMLPSKHL